MNDFETIVNEAGGLLKGHTVFRNGFHGNGYVEKGFIIRKPRLLNLVTKLQADKVLTYYPDVDLLVGPIGNGAMVTSFVARHLEKEIAVSIGTGEELGFHRMNLPASNRKVVLIEDLVFTGTNVRDHVKFLKKYGMQMLGVVVWINRQMSNFGDVSCISLMNPPFEKYEPVECPLCKKNIPIIYHDIRE